MKRFARRGLVTSLIPPISRATSQPGRCSVSVAVAVGVIDACLEITARAHAITPSDEARLHLTVARLHRQAPYRLEESDAY